MVRHVWTVLCYKASVDIQDNKISLLDVLEKLQFELDLADFDAEIARGATVFPFPFQVVSWFVRDDFSSLDEAAEFQGRLRVLSPDGESIGDRLYDAAISAGHTGARMRVNFKGLDMRDGFGVYWFVSELREGGEEEWREQTRIPLQVVHIPRTEEPGENAEA